MIAGNGPIVQPGFVRVPISAIFEPMRTACGATTPGTRGRPPVARRAPFGDAAADRGVCCVARRGWEARPRVMISAVTMLRSTPTETTPAPDAAPETAAAPQATTAAEIVATPHASTAPETAAALHATTAPEVAATPDAVGSNGLIARLGLVTFGLFLSLMTPVIVTLALKVGEIDPAHKARSLGLVTAPGALVALVANPLFGRLADRTRTRFGRRLPWLVAGGTGGAAGLLMIALASNLWTVLCGWCLTQLSYNAALSALYASVPEQIPPQRRGRMSGVIGLARTAGLISGTGLAAIFAGHTVGQFMVAPVLLLAAIAFAATRLRDRTVAAKPARMTLREFGRTFWINPRHHPNLGWYWLTRFCFTLGGVFPMGYLVYYLPDQLSVASGRIAATIFVFTATSAGTTMLIASAGGWLSDRLGGRRKAFVVAACAANVVALGLFALTHSVAVGVAAEAIIGVGNGLYYSVDMAIVSHVLPDPESFGKDIGVVNIANTVPQFIGPALAPALLSLGGYGLLFGSGALSVAVAGGLIMKVRSVR
jgi:MFS family permease